jgi:hypothetical protein
MSLLPKLARKLDATSSSSSSSSANNDSSFIIGRINVDKAPWTSVYFDIEAVPSIFLVRDGSLFEYTGPTADIDAMAFFVAENYRSSPARYLPRRPFAFEFLPGELRTIMRLLLIYINRYAHYITIGAFFYGLLVSWIASRMSTA